MNQNKGRIKRTLKSLMEETIAYLEIQKKRSWFNINQTLFEEVPHSVVFWHVFCLNRPFYTSFPHFQQRRAIFAWLFVQRSSSLFLLTQDDTLTALMGGNSMICLRPQKCCNYSTLNIANARQMGKSVTAFVAINVYICVCKLCTKLLALWSCKTGVLARKGYNVREVCKKIWPDNSLHSDT